MLRNAMASLTLGAVLLGAAGCGDTFRPPESSISPVGPASQPAKYAVAVADPGNGNPGIFTMVDFSGDTVLNTTAIGISPQYFILGFSGTEAYVLNKDGSVNSFGISSSLQSNQIQTSTLFSGAGATSIFPSGGYTYFTEPYPLTPANAAIAEAQGSPPSVKQELGVGTGANPVFIAGTQGASRIYSINQGINTVTAIQTATNTISNTINVGHGPVYGVMTADNNRAFILNKTDGTVSVINVNTNQLDSSTTTYTNPITVGGGPVWADLYAAGSLLATANSTGNSVSIISIPLCSIVALPTNPSCIASNPTDAAGFGTLLATVPVGTDPQMVSILQDGTRAYVANFNATNVSGTSIVGDLSAITGFSVTNGTATINANNNYVVGSYVALSGVTNNGTFLDGGPYTVLGATSSQFQVGVTAPNASSVAPITGFAVSNGAAAITGFSVSNDVATFTTSTSNLIGGQNVTIAGLTGTGAFLNGGPYTVLYGVTQNQFQISFNSATIAQTEDAGTATGSSVATLTANNSFIFGQNVTISGLTGTGAFLNGGSYSVLSGGTSTQFQINVSPSATVTQTSATGTATGQIAGTATEGTATITAPNSYAAGASVMLGGLRNGAGPYINGGPYKVLPAGLSATQFEVEVPYGTAAATSDIGTTSVAGTYGSVSVVSLTTFTVTKTIVFDGNTANPDGSTNLNHGPYCHPNFIATSQGTPTGKVDVSCPDGSNLTILETDTDSVDTTIPLQGYAVQMRVTAQ